MVGSGVSYGLVCLPGPLLKQRKVLAEKELGIPPIEINLDARDALYEWAEKALQIIEDRGDAIPKLSLAKSLGILESPEWTAKVGLPLRGTLPRHRVMARLAKERRLASIWSFNWDGHIENALEKIGVSRGATLPSQPWPVGYKSVVERSDFQAASNPDVIEILKPHGCVWAMTKAAELQDAGQVDAARILADRFLITRAELREPEASATSKKFHSQLKNDLQRNQVVIAGWSISEPYLQDVFNPIVLSDLIECELVEELSILDVCFWPGHEQAATCYKLKQDDVFFELLGNDLQCDLDQLMLWLQANFALDQLLLHAKSCRHAIEDNRTAIELPASRHFLMDWADTFLPAWCRLCWSAELVPCANFDTHQLRIELEDHYVPLDTPGVLRPDLVCAGELLSILDMKSSRWDCSRFPGALFDEAEAHICLPVPAWGEINDLYGLRPFLRAVERDIGFVSKVSLLPMVPGGATKSVAPNTIEALRSSVSSELRVQKFSRPDNINVIQPVELNHA